MSACISYQSKTRAKYRISIERECDNAEDVESLIDDVSSQVGRHIGRFFVDKRPRNPMVEWEIKSREICRKIIDPVDMSTLNKLAYQVEIVVDIWYD